MYSLSDLLFFVHFTKPLHPELQAYHKVYNVLTSLFVISYAQCIGSARNIMTFS